MVSEHIRYAWGTSSLGDFFAAASADGLVAFEFFMQDTAMLDTLGMRFPDAVIVEDRKGLADMVRKLAHLVEHPDRGTEIVLDLRGSDYQKKVWMMLREIPAGETTHYGSPAARLGTRDAREVTDAISSNAIAILIPCHRVIRKDGSIAGYRWGARRKRVLLQRERPTELFLDA